MRIRSAGPEDIHTILDLIRDLAIYEKEPHQAKATPEQLHRALFSPTPTAHCELVEVDHGEIRYEIQWIQGLRSAKIAAHS